MEMIATIVSKLAYKSYNLKKGDESDLRLLSTMDIPVGGSFGKKHGLILWVFQVGRVPSQQICNPIVNPEIPIPISHGYLWVSYPQECLGNTINTMGTLLGGTPNCPLKG